MSTKKKVNTSKPKHITISVDMDEVQKRVDNIIKELKPDVIMKDQLRQEIIEKAKHLHTCQQEIIEIISLHQKKIQALQKEHEVKMNGLHDVFVDKQRKLGMLVRSVSDNFGIVFERPAEYGKYLHS